MRQQGHRVRQIAPGERLLVQRQQIGAGVLRNACGQRGRVGSSGAGGEIAVPQRHVEGRMLAAHETGDADAIFTERGQRQQRQRTALGIAGDHEKGGRALAFTDLALPGGEEIETLIGRMSDVAAFELTPDGFGLAEFSDDVDGRNTARLRPVARLRRPAIDCRSHGHQRYLSETVYNFRLGATFAGNCQQRVIRMPLGPRGMFRGCKWRRKTGS